MSETVVKKSFMDKFTGFFYKFGHYMLMIMAYVATIALAIITGILAGVGHFKFEGKTLAPSVIFIVSIILIGLSLVFSFVKPLRKVANWFFAILGFVSVTIVGIVSGIMFFKDPVNGSFDYKGAINGDTNIQPWGAISGGCFIVSCILIGLVVIGGIMYAISMSDNWKKERQLKKAREA